MLMPAPPRTTHAPPGLLQNEYRGKIDVSPPPVSGRPVGSVAPRVNSCVQAADSESRNDAATCRSPKSDRYPSVRSTVPLAEMNGALKYNSNRRLRGTKALKLPPYPFPPNG